MESGEFSVARENTALMEINYSDLRGCPGCDTCKIGEGENGESEEIE